MTVTKERAMQMFDRDLAILMDDLRGMQAHYQIADWEAFVFLRKPDCPESYVMKYAAAVDEFAKRIVQLHAAPAAPVVARELFSRLIKLAAAVIAGHDFISPYADDNPKTTPRAILDQAEKQRERLRLWAIEIRAIADKLSAAIIVRLAAPEGDVESILQRLVETPAGERIRMKCGAADLRSVITDVLASKLIK